MGWVEIGIGLAAICAVLFFASLLLAPKDYLRKFSIGIIENLARPSDCYVRQGDRFYRRVMHQQTIGYIFDHQRRLQYY